MLQIKSGLGRQNKSTSLLKVLAAVVYFAACHYQPGNAQVIYDALLAGRFLAPAFVPTILYAAYAAPRTASLPTLVSQPPITPPPLPPFLVKSSATVPSAFVESATPPCLPSVCHYPLQSAVPRVGLGLSAQAAFPPPPPDYQLNTPLPATDDFAYLPPRAPMSETNKIRYSFESVPTKLLPPSPSSYAVPSSPTLDVAAPLLSVIDKPAVSHVPSLCTPNMYFSYTSQALTPDSVPASLPTDFALTPPPFDKSIVAPSPALLAYSPCPPAMPAEISEFDEPLSALVTQSLTSAALPQSTVAAPPPQVSISPLPAFVPATLASVASAPALTPAASSFAAPPFTPAASVLFLPAFAAPSNPSISGSHRQQQKQNDDNNNSSNNNFNLIKFHSLKSGSKQPQAKFYQRSSNMLATRCVKM